jgi:hypothetical protein
MLTALGLIAATQRGRNCSVYQLRDRWRPITVEQAADRDDRAHAAQA